VLSQHKTEDNHVTSQKIVEVITYKEQMKTP